MLRACPQVLALQRRCEESEGRVTEAEGVASDALRQLEAVKTRALEAQRNADDAHRCGNVNVSHLGGTNHDAPGTCMEASYCGLCCAGTLLCRYGRYSAQRLTVVADTFCTALQAGV